VETAAKQQQLLLEAYCGLVVVAAAVLQQQHLAVYHVWPHPAATAVRQGSSGCNPRPRLVQAAALQQVQPAVPDSSQRKVQNHVRRLQLLHSHQGRVAPAWMEAVYHSLQ
jgi:hypothetical protein